MRKRWPDGNRRAVATRYATAAREYKVELLRPHLGTSGQREAVEALRGLNPWGSGGSFVELVAWLGEFDSARTLLEEWPAMGRFTNLQNMELVEKATRWSRGLGPVPDLPCALRYDRREVGGPPPEWMRKWLPLVAEWERGRRGRGSGIVL